MSGYTPSLVEARLAEAADVLRRLPDERVQGYFTVWPDPAYEFSDLVEQAPTQRRVRPTPAAITRMEETLTWPRLLDPVDARIIWMRAFGEPWKTVCWTVGLSRQTAHQRWLYGLCVISLKLNRRRFNRNLARRKVIALAQAAQGCVDASKAQG